MFDLIAFAIGILVGVAVYLTCNRNYNRRVRERREVGE